VCTVLGHDLPCATELAACEVAEADTRSSGSAATFDSVYSVFGGPGDSRGKWTPSDSVCSPAASFGAYKNDYKLNEFAAEADDGTCTKEGTAAVCVALDDADADACGALTTETDCLALVTAASDADCTETAETSVADDKALCDAVTTLDDDGAACMAVKTTATETCAADGAENGAAVDPDACTYHPAAEEASKCAWSPAGADTVLSAEVVDYQTCIASSRASAYQADMNCLESVGAATCGGEYECTYVPPPPGADAGATADRASSSGGFAAGLALAAASVVATQL